MDCSRRDQNRAAAAGSASTPVSRPGLLTPSVSNYPAPDEALQCCCGKVGCIFLQHNCIVLESVENDVRTAAKLGQSLLERHETYMANAERDRAELIDRIGKLEMDKRELEAENGKKIRENRALLDQLESLSNTVADTDTQIKMLEASLQSSQQMIRRLEGAAERAEDMERHLAVLEAEQAVLQTSLVTSESEARSAIQRWKRAEQGLADLQFQLDVMERESREEQMRHQEIMDRMRRQRAIEKELNTAAGRLKGAAATTNLLQESKTGAGSAVVSHFVRDLLQDNANLQLGMAELRDMLVASNDEIQALRDQLVYHQPLFEQNAGSTSTLRAELDSKLLPYFQKGEEGAQQDTQQEYDAGEASMTLSALATPRTARHHQSSLSQEFHIHHHYHVSGSGRKMESKKPKRKRAGITPTLFTPPSAALSTPSTPLYRPSLTYRPDHSVAAALGSSPPLRRGQHLGRDSISTVMSGPSTRWSLFSDQPSDLSMSSVPSSPRTDPRHSVFDCAPLSDMSVPVSPTTSVDPMSPMWRVSSRKQSIEDSRQTNGFPRPFLFSSPVPQTKQQCQPLFQFPEAIKEDEETDAHMQCNVNASASNDLDESNAGKSADDLPNTALSVTERIEFASSEAISPTLMQSSPTLSYETIPDDGTLASDGDIKDSYNFSKRSSRPLHRSVSHESIISLQGGLDIHTLKARPSQLTLRPLGTAMADTGLSSITARPFISKAGSDTLRSNSILRDRLSLGAPASRPLRSTPSGATHVNTSLSNTSSVAATVSGSRMLGKFVAWRPWGNGSNGTNTAMPSTATSVQSSLTAATAALTMAAQVAPATQPKAITTTVSNDSASLGEGNSTMQTDPARCEPPDKATTSVQSAAVAVDVPKSSVNEAAAGSQHQTAPKAFNDLTVLRSPGINQPGAIPGFLEYWAAHQRRGAPSNVHAGIVDEEALREGLLEV
ncbi:hypothetical protein SEPCBS119000_005141 [Sporothrix epigloea]|uniref:Uncharacterized protein n=1 Tax=Sporothrix epigloea TaxID=1892477 RepID=A0ABP0DVY4_9PEZI